MSTYRKKIIVPAVPETEKEIVDYVKCDLCDRRSHKTNYKD